VLTFVLPLLVQVTVEAPRTVNGIELGPADDFATTGPARVCMREMVISPRAGETAYLAYSGIHHGGIRLVLANGKDLEFIYGEIFRNMRRPGQGTSIRAKDMRVYLYDDENGAQYQVHVLLPETEWSEGGWQPVVNVRGTALMGNRADAQLFERLSFSRNVDCDRQYNFGLDLILDGEPVDQTSAQ
jgi:hypothetical protein